MTPHVLEYLPDHAELFMKLAKSSYEEDVPWLTGAGGGAVGHEIAKKLVKGKGQVPAAIAATVLGTALGVKGGRSLGRVLDKPSKGEVKEAHTKKKEKPTEPGSTGKILRTVGTGIAGLTTGTLAGYGAGRLAESAAKRMGKKIPMKYVVPAATAAGAGLNLAHSMWKAHEMEALRRAVEGK